MKRCPQCGVQDHDEAILCKNCMRNFASGPPVPARASKRNASNFPTFVVLLIVGAVVFASKYPETVEELVGRTKEELAALMEGGSSEPASPEAADVLPPPAESTPVAPQPPPEPPANDVPVREEPQPRAVAESGSPASEETRALRQPDASPVAVTPPAVRPEPRRSEPRRPESRPLEADRPPRTPAAEPTAVALPPPSAQPIRVGGNIKAPAKLRDVTPAYPAVAQASRVQGIVIIEATIGPDGSVRDARVLRSIPLLDDAALEAVRQWQYQPTMLNGVAVPVIMTVTVNFRLQ